MYHSVKEVVDHEKVSSSGIWFALCLSSALRRDSGSLFPSEMHGASPSSRASDTETIRTALEQKLVRQRLADLGFSADEISARLSELRCLVHYFASKLDELKVGGDGLGILIAILVIVILVLLILHLTGHRVSVGK
jgi:hypothetical protein